MTKMYPLVQLDATVAKFLAPLLCDGQWQDGLPAAGEEYYPLVEGNIQLLQESFQCQDRKSGQYSAIEINGGYVQQPATSFQVEAWIAFV